MLKEIAKDTVRGVIFGLGVLEGILDSTIDLLVKLV